MVKKYKAEYIRLEDEIFLLDKKKVEEFLENLEKKDYKIYWWATARANFFQDPEAIDSLLAKMKKLGCFHLGIGVESGSRHMLEFYKKQITLEQVEKAAMMCNKYDFPVIYPFIVGSPHETTEEVFMSLKFAGKLKKIHPGGTMIFHTFRPHQGCELYNEAVNLGFKNQQTLEAWIPKSRSSVRGYCSLADLPWLKNPEFLEYLAIFGELTYQKLSRIKLLLRPLVFLESLVFKMRLKFNFWHLLLEKELYFFLKKHGLFTYIRKILRN